MPASNHRTARMEDVQRRRFRDFVALAIPAVWLSASPFLLIAFGVDLPIAVGAAVFAATFVHAAYLARPRPMDRRVLRPIMIGSLLLAAATIAPRIIAFVTNDTYLNVGVSVSILIVTVLVVRSQVLKVIGWNQRTCSEPDRGSGEKPTAPHLVGSVWISSVPRCGWLGTFAASACGIDAGVLRDLVHPRGRVPTVPKMESSPS